MKRIVRLVLIALLLTSIPAVAAQPPPEVWQTYHDYDSLIAELSELGTSYPRLVSVTSIGRSVQGRKIWLLNITNRDAPGPKPALLFTGGMHGSEMVGVEAVIQYARFLLTEHSSNGTAKRIVDQWITYLIPMLNPDGVAAGKTSFSSSGARKNARNVDLNRNFDWSWENGGADPARHDYRGYKPYSEPESQALANFLETIRIITYMDAHSGEGPAIYVPSAGSRDDVSVAREVAAAMGFKVGTAKSAGEAVNWARGRKNIPSFLIELYADRSVSSTGPSWWDHYNPPTAKLFTTLAQARNAMVLLTLMSAGSEAASVTVTVPERLEIAAQPSEPPSTSWVQTTMLVAVIAVLLVILTKLKPKTNSR